MEKNPEKSSGIVLPVLISVLAAVVVSAGGFGLGYGTGFVLEKTAGEPSQSLAQPADETGRASSVTGSSFGPNVRVENGAVTWRSDAYLSYLGGATNVSNPTQASASSSSGEPAASGTYTHDFSGGRVLATTASNNNNDPVYHTEDCSAAVKISPDDEYWYASAADAEADGRRLCGICGR